MWELLRLLWFLDFDAKVQGQDIKTTGILRKIYYKEDSFRKHIHHYLPNQRVYIFRHSVLKGKKSLLDSISAYSLHAGLVWFSLFSVIWKELILFVWMLVVHIQAITHLSEDRSIPLAMTLTASHKAHKRLVICSVASIWNVQFVFGTLFLVT